MKHGGAGAEIHRQSAQRAIDPAQGAAGSPDAAGGERGHALAKRRRRAIVDWFTSAV